MKESKTSDLFSIFSQAALEKKRTVKAEVQVGQIQAILDYLSHIKHTHAIHRNLLLLRFMKSHKEAIHDKSGAVKAGSEKATKPEEFVRVYDILLQVRIITVYSSTMYKWRDIFRGKCLLMVTNRIH